MERSGRYIPWAVFLLALVLRLFHVLQLDASPLFAHPAVDSLTYAEHAARLAAGNWPGYGEGPFWQPPLYPYFLGLLKTFFPQSFFYAVRFVQALLGALSCVLLYVLGSHLFRPAVGAGAALGAALCGTLIFFDGELLPASLATFLDLAGLVLLLRALRPGLRLPAAAAGNVVVLGGADRAYEHGDRHGAARDLLRRLGRRPQWRRQASGRRGGADRGARQGAETRARAADPPGGREAHAHALRT